MGKRDPWRPYNSVDLPISSTYQLPNVACMSCGTALYLHVEAQPGRHCWVLGVHQHQLHVTGFESALHVRPRYTCI